MVVACVRLLGQMYTRNFPNHVRWDGGIWRSAGLGVCYQMGWFGFKRVEIVNEGWWREQVVDLGAGRPIG